MTEKAENTRGRTRAREIALKILYQNDLVGGTPEEEWTVFVKEQEENLTVAAYATRLIKGTIEQGEDLDKTIKDVAKNWDLNRMAVIDRNIIRMAAYEILHESDVPRNVAINEAVELAKKYSTEKSPAFVNGIVDKIGVEEEGS